MYMSAEKKEKKKCVSSIVNQFRLSLSVTKSWLLSTFSAGNNTVVSADSGSAEPLSPMRD